MSNPLNGARPVFVKTVSVLTSVATILSLSGAAYLAPLVASAAVPSDYGLTEGNTISASGTNDPDIYIVNALGYKRLFLNPVIFSFYGHLGGFANVRSVSATARDAFPTSGLFRNCETNAQQVWAVEVTGEDTGIFHKVTMSGDQAVAEDANFFKKVFCINNNEQNWYSKSPNDYTSLSQVPVYSRVPGSTPTPTPVGVGPVSASLSPDNPAAGTVIAGQGVADLAHFRLTNPAGNAVAVNSLKLQRLGISGDTTFANVYIFNLNPNSRLTDSVTPSSGVISVNGGTSTNTIVTVPAYSYVDIAVKVDIFATNTSGQTLGVALTQVNGMAVSGLNGNLFQVAAAPSDLATAVWAATASILPATGTTDPIKDAVVWQNQLTISNKNVTMKSFALRQVNSINNSDVSNFRLFVDGTQVAQTQNLDSNGYVTFNPVSPVTILTGSRTIKVIADITGGTGRKLTMSLRSSADVQLTDSNYGSGVSSTITSSGTFPANAGDLTINSGSIVVQRDVTSPSSNIVKGASDAVLGRWLFTAYGEATKVSTLIAGLRHSNGGGTAGTNVGNLRNGRIMAYPVGNPSAAQQFGSTSNLAYSVTASTSYTTNLTVSPGTPMIVEVRADMYDNDGTDNVTAGDTLTSTLYTGASNGQGMVSLAVTNVPTSQSAANQLTVVAGSSTISKYANFTDQTITTPQTGKKIGDFVFTGGTSEAINVNTLTLDVTVGAGASINDLTNVYLKYNGVATSTKATISATGNTYSVSAVLAANSSVRIEVFADLGTRTAGSTATYQSKVAVSGTTAQSAQTVNTQADGTSSTGAAATFAGQVLTVGSGTLTSSLVSDATTIAKNITANTTNDVSKFNFIAINDTFTISEIQLKTTASSSEQGIMSVILKNTATGATIGTLPLTLSGASQFATFGNLSLSVPGNDANGLNLTAQVVSGNVGVNAATTGLNVALTLNYIKKAPASTNVITTDATDRAGNAQYLYNAIPVVSAIALPTTLLAGSGTQTIAKWSVTTSGTSGAQTGWNQALFTVAKSSGPNIASSGMQLFVDGVLDTTPTFRTKNIGTSQTSGYIYVIANNSPTDEFQVPVAGHTYELKATVTNTTTNDSINLTLGQPSTHQTTSTLANLIFNTSSASFIWTDRTDTNFTGGVNGHSSISYDWQNDYLIKNLPFTQALSR